MEVAPEAVVVHPQVLPVLVIVGRVRPVAGLVHCAYNVVPSLWIQLALLSVKSSTSGISAPLVELSINRSPLVSAVYQPLNA